MFRDIRMHVRHVGRASARRASISAFCCSSSLILALMAGWHIPSRSSRDSLLFSLDLLKSAAARFRLRTPIMVLAVRLSRDFR
jgi:hypothetical protein